MGDPYGPILTGIGLLQGGKLSPAGLQSYTSEVLQLLAGGNAKGQSPALAPWGTLIGGFPPVPGPTIVNVTTLSEEPLFWFGPDPIAELMAATLIDDTKCPIWQTLFPNGIVSTTATALDLPGNTALFPLFDVSVAFPNITVFPIALPDLAVQVGIPLLPKLLIKLAGLGIKLSLPSLPSLPTLTLPSFGFPPSLALQAAIAIPQLILGMIELPFKLLLKLLLPPNLSLILDLIQFKFTAVFNIAFSLLLELLLPLVPIVPKLIVASLLVWLKDTVSMLCVDLVGMIVGSGGFLTKSVGIATGLIPAGGSSSSNSSSPGSSDPSSSTPSTPATPGAPSPPAPPSGSPPSP